MGAERVEELLTAQREIYAYLHDQTLRLLNQGFQGTEIAETIELPPALENNWAVRGYYGSVSHNVKAIYQRYMGWFDGSPARLWPHTPENLAKRYVDAIGGVDRVIEVAQEAYDSGDYRWAATLLDHAIFADPDYSAARALYADTLDQLAYGVENATWRNFFLSGATELRGRNFGTPTDTNPTEMLMQLTPSQIFDALAIAVDGPKAWDLDFTIDVVLTDLDQTHRLRLRNGVLIHRRKIDKDGAADTTVTTTKLRLLALGRGDASSPGIEIDGDPSTLVKLTGVLDKPDPAFNIVLP